MLFNRSKISSRIIWSYFFLLAVIFFLVIFSLYQLERVNYIATEIEVNWLPATRTLGDINKGLSEVRIAEYQHVSASTPEEMEALTQAVAEKIQWVMDEQKVYEPLIVLDEEKRLYDRFCQRWETYRTENQKIITASANDRKQEALLLLGSRSQELFGEMNDLLYQLIDLNEEGGIATSHRGDSIFALSSVQIIGLGALALVVGIIICIFMTYFLITTVSVTRKYKFLSGKR